MQLRKLVEKLGGGGHMVQAYAAQGNVDVSAGTAGGDGELSGGWGEDNDNDEGTD